MAWDADVEIDQGVMGGLLTLPSFLKFFPEVNTVNPPPGSSASHAATIQAIMGTSQNLRHNSIHADPSTVGAYTLGCFFGAIATIWLGNMLGRKKTIFTGSVIMIIGAILQTASFSLPQLIVGRWITGFGNGMNTSTVPTWQSETSKPHRRGQMVMIEGSLIVFGVMLSYWLDLGFSFLEPSSIAWRFPIAFQIILAIFILVFIPGLPESPRWLVLKGRNEEALEVLAALSDLPPEDKRIQQEYLEVKDVVFEMSKGGFRECFKLNKNRNFHRTVLAYVNQMFQQVSAAGPTPLRWQHANHRKDLGHQPCNLLRCLCSRNKRRSLPLPQPPHLRLQRHRIRTFLPPSSIPTPPTH